MNIRDQLESAKEIFADCKVNVRLFNDGNWPNTTEYHKRRRYYWKRRVAILKRLAGKP